jgi:SAM-dependent methyltransferase
VARFLGGRRFNTPGCWEKKWRRQKKRSRLSKTQEISPEKWGVFYNEVSDLWLSMWGAPFELGYRVADVLTANSVILPGGRILDAGCGSGSIGIPFARRGMNVTAVDNSPAMLDQLRLAAEKENIRNIEIIRSEWDDYIRTFRPPRFDCAVAAFFPSVFSPDGIRELETLSDCCCLIMGDGEDPFPYRKELWQRILGRPLPDRRHSLLCAYNYLESSKREPKVRHLSWPAALDMGLDDLVRFYSSYFAIFGHESGETAAIISNCLSRYALRGMVRKTGTVHVAAIWWKNGEKRN